MKKTTGKKRHLHIHLCQSGNSFACLSEFKGDQVRIRPHISRKLIDNDWHEYESFLATAVVYDLMRLGADTVVEHPPVIGQIPLFEL